MKLCVLFALALPVFLAACPQPVPVNPPVDSEVGADTTPGDDAGVEDTTSPMPDDAKSSVTLACAELRKLHCPEGNAIDGGQTCEALMQHVINTNLTTVNPTCIAKATTAKAARACSAYVTCPGQP